jgi:hypothetical protein
MDAATATDFDFDYGAGDPGDALFDEGIVSELDGDPSADELEWLDVEDAYVDDDEPDSDLPDGWDAAVEERARTVADETIAELAPILEQLAQLAQQSGVIGEVFQGQSEYARILAGDEALEQRVAELFPDVDPSAARAAAQQIAPDVFARFGITDETIGAVIEAGALVARRDAEEAQALGHGFERMAAEINALNLAFGGGQVDPVQVALLAEERSGGVTTGPEEAVRLIQDAFHELNARGPARGEQIARYYGHRAELIRQASRTAGDTSGRPPDRDPSVKAPSRQELVRKFNRQATDRRIALGLIPPDRKEP